MSDRQEFIDRAAFALFPMVLNEAWKARYTRTGEDDFSLFLADQASLKTSDIPFVYDLAACLYNARAAFEAEGGFDG